MFSKKYNIIRVFILSGLIMITLSCKKGFLNVIPKGVTTAQETTDYELLLNDPNLSILGLASNIAMSDEVAGFKPYFDVGLGIGTISDVKAFEWQNDIYQPDDINSELTQLEKQLYTYNKVINEVMDSKGGSNQKKLAIRSEAMVGRAWVNFTLINYYGKPYNEVTAAIDPGIPLPVIADVTQTVYKRSSVKEAYDLIVSDLKEAIPHLPTQIVSRRRITKTTAEAILGKVYIYLRKFDNALPLLNSAIEGLSNSIIPIGIYDYNGAFDQEGVFFPTNPFTGPNRNDPNSDIEILYMKSVMSLYSYILSGLTLSPQTTALYSQADLRRFFLSSSPFPPTQVFQYPLGMLRSFGKVSINSGVNVPDIYLLKAECESRLGDLSEAVRTIESFRMKRMSVNVVDAANVPLEIAENQIALTKYILEERIREFALTGERWFDMRRLSVDELYKTTVGPEHIVYDETGNALETFSLRPERLTLRFPQYIMFANPGMSQNP